MEKIFEGILNKRREILSSADFNEIKGNDSFIEILNSYPEFVEGVKGIKNETRGKPTDNPTPKEVKYLCLLVKELYVARGKEYNSTHDKNLKDSLKGAIGGADFFDRVKSKHWTDIFSALDYKLKLFSRGENRFDVFFNNYISLYGKLNNKKVVPFYARWIREIAAMYTVYLNETFDEFESIRDRLNEALREGMSKKSDARTPHYETDTVRSYIMTTIFSLCDKSSENKEKNKEETLVRLCNYIRDNPDEFVYEGGDLEYRRYFYTIKEMLCWLENSENKDQFYYMNEDEDLIETFSADNIDYTLKDQKLRKLEYSIVIDFLNMTREDEDEFLDFLVDAPCVYEANYTRLFKSKRYTKEIINKDETIYYSILKRIAIDSETESVVFLERTDNCCEGDYVDRELEMVADCVVKLLRLSIMLSVIYKGIIKPVDSFERPSRENIIYGINRIMRGLGLIPLPVNKTNSYNSKSLLDFCVVKYIEKAFKSDDEED